MPNKATRIAASKQACLFFFFFGLLLLLLLLLFLFFFTWTTSLTKHSVEKKSNLTRQNNKNMPAKDDTLSRHSPVMLTERRLTSWSTVC